MTYRDGTATGDAKITFSIDGGKSYDAPEHLIIVDVRGNSKQAGPEDYTHIRWEFSDPLDAGESQLVEFRARLD